MEMIFYVHFKKWLFQFYIANCLLLLKWLCTVLMKCALRRFIIEFSLYLFGEERKGFSDMETVKFRELFFANTVLWLDSV